MATHSSVLAWRIPWTEEPGGLQSMVSQRVGHDWVTHTHTHTHTQSWTRLSDTHTHTHTHTHTQPGSEGQGAHSLAGSSKQIPGKQPKFIQHNTGEALKIFQEAICVIFFLFFTLWDKVCIYIHTHTHTHKTNVKDSCVSFLQWSQRYPLWLKDPSQEALGCQIFWVSYILELLLTFFLTFMTLTFFLVK